MASVTIKNVAKSFEGTEVLKEVSLEIADREFLVLVGPSGCGKSTLLRLIAGLEEATSGEIHIGGKLVNEVPPSGREIAMVFQDYALYPHMTVEENMSFGLRLRRVAKPEIDRRVREAAAILQIEPLLKRTPRQLSGGQRQRVAIGRAIVRQPQAFLFDEPLSNLDAKLREEMRVEIAKLHQRLKTTAIYVTHDQVEAMTLASRIAIMYQGKLQQIGTPQELYDTPVNLFVAGFIGSPTMNFVDGLLEEDDGKSRFIADGFSVTLPRAAKAAGAAVLGVRPEALTVTAGEGNGIPASVEVVELLGHKKNLHVRAGGSKMLAVVESSFAARPGDTVDLRLKTGAAHLFDKQTTLRM